MENKYRGGRTRVADIRVVQYAVLYSVSSNTYDRLHGARGKFDVLVGQIQLRGYAVSTKIPSDVVLISRECGLTHLRLFYLLDVDQNVSIARLTEIEYAQPGATRGLSLLVSVAVAVQGYGHHRGRSITLSSCHHKSLSLVDAASYFFYFGST